MNRLIKGNPIICLPQMVSGLFWGYARIKYSILGGILLHGILNGVGWCMGN